jgi:hypothetical protein
MVIKKVRSFIDKIKKNPLRNKPSVIIGLRSKSTLIGRQKVIFLKKIGRNKRDNK